MSSYKVVCLVLIIFVCFSFKALRSKVAHFNRRLGPEFEVSRSVSDVEDFEDPPEIGPGPQRPYSSVSRRQRRIDPITSFGSALRNGKLC